MARTADRYLKGKRKDKATKKVYRAGNYLRLSVDSDYTGSDSLDNQRRLAKEYVDKNPDLIIEKEYIDDGKTGTNFNRPAFTRMITDLKAGLIDCVIVKDLSRFGREYIETGNYIEKVFPFLGVRFISIVDRYDSGIPGCDRELLLISLKNLMHEMYARDISKKVGSTFQIKHEKKMFYRSAKIPYGYKMDQDNNNYCIDEPAATIVREIFSQYVRGVSRYAIRVWLYDNHVVTPFQYIQTGSVYEKDENSRNVWQSSTIRRILKNTVYIGEIVRHQTVQSFFEGKKAETVPEEEQVVLKKNHPPIVSEEVFAKAQEILQQKWEKSKEYRKDSDTMREDVLFHSNVFRGKIFCGNCKTDMTRSLNYRTVDGQLERFKVFKCTTHIHLSQYCDSRGIDENELCKIIFAMIQKHMLLIKGIKKLLEQDVDSLFEDRLRKLRHERQNIQNNQIRLQQEYMQTYTNFIDKNLHPEKFQDFRCAYMERMNRAKMQLKELELKEKQIKKHRSDVKKMITTWLQFENEKELTEEMIESCVDRVEVFPDSRIEITLRYQDCFHMLQSWLEKGEQ